MHNHAHRLREATHPPARVVGLWSGTLAAIVGAEMMDAHNIRRAETAFVKQLFETSKKHVGTIVHGTRKHGTWYSNPTVSAAVNHPALSRLIQSTRARFAVAFDGDTVLLKSNRFRTVLKRY